MSSIRNSPTSRDSARKPPSVGSYPGVENKNDKVVRNMSTAPALPMAVAMGDQCRRAINVAMMSSTPPLTAMNCRTVAGSPVDPWYRFALEDGKIARLEIICTYRKRRSGCHGLSCDGSWIGFSTMTCVLVSPLHSLRWTVRSRAAFQFVTEKSFLLRHMMLRPRPPMDTLRGDDVGAAVFPF